MALAEVEAGRRFTRSHPCPICAGHAGMPQGKGIRCAGFLSSDGEYAHCTREEHAGALPPSNATPATFAHKMHGPCGCGDQHGAAISTFPTPAQVPSKKGDLGRVVAEYPYYDATGQLAYSVVRFEPKTFRPRRSDGNGGYRYDLEDMRRILYRLPDLLNHPDAPVYIVEGEKDVESLRRLGLVATTNQGGANQWHHTLDAAQVLSGRDIIILPDNDEKGEKHTAQVIASLEPFARTIKIVRLPNLPPKGDITDWLQTGGTRTELEHLVTATPCYPEEAPPKRVYRLISRQELRAIPTPTYLIDGLLPESGIAFLVGPPKAYKSFLALDWGCSISCDEQWNGHETKGGFVVYLAGEGLGGINKRITAWELHHHRDVERLFTIGEAVRLLSPPMVTELLTVLKDVPTPPKLVIIDTLSRAMVGGDVLSSKDIMQAIDAADRIRATYNCLVLIVHHTNKADGILGSISIPGGADAIIMLEPDGSQVTVHNEKMKDFDEFADFAMIAQSVIIDEATNTHSLILVPGEAELLESEQIALTALAAFGFEGASAVEWQKAASGPKLSERNFYKVRGRLVERQLVHMQAKGQGQKYTITEYGHYLLNHTTALTAQPLHYDGVQEPLETTTPPYKGVVVSSSGAMQSSAAQNQAAKSAVKHIKPLPTAPCGRCHTVSWAHKPSGDVVCSKCIPPRTWK